MVERGDRGPARRRDRGDDAPERAEAAGDDDGLSLEAHAAISIAGFGAAKSRRIASRSFAAVTALASLTRP